MKFLLFFFLYRGHRGFWLTGGGDAHQQVPLIHDVEWCLDDVITHIPYNLQAAQAVAMEISLPHTHTLSLSLYLFIYPPPQQ